MCANRDRAKGNLGMEIDRILIDCNATLHKGKTLSKMLWNCLVEPRPVDLVFISMLLSLYYCLSWSRASGDLMEIENNEQKVIVRKVEEERFKPWT